MSFQEEDEDSYLFTMGTHMMHYWGHLLYTAMNISLDW